jgi:hypothetical protein
MALSKNKHQSRLKALVIFRNLFCISTVSVVRGCCFVVICIVLLEAGWVGTAVVKMRSLVRVCCLTARESSIACCVIPYLFYGCQQVSSKMENTGIHRQIAQT